MNAHATPHRKSKIVHRTFDGAVECASGSVDETHALGERLGALLQPGDVVALSGELGSGKTTLIQGMAKGMGKDPAIVKSPTFVLMREYSGDVPIVHIDGYRLGGASAASWLDLDLIFAPGKVTLIEWAERFEGLLPVDRLELSLSHVSTHRRRLKAMAHGARGKALLEAWQHANATTRESHEPSPMPVAEEGNDGDSRD